MIGISVIKELKELKSRVLDFDVLYWYAKVREIIDLWLFNFIF